MAKNTGIGENPQMDNKSYAGREMGVGGAKSAINSVETNFQRTQPTGNQSVDGRNSGGDGFKGSN